VVVSVVKESPNLYGDSYNKRGLIPYSTVGKKNALLPSSKRAVIAFVVWISTQT
jgi:hypothetical protein